MDSSQANSGLMFMAFTERIPERGTPVRLILQVIDPAAADARPAASNIPVAEPATELKGEPQPSDPAGEQPVE